MKKAILCGIFAAAALMPLSANAWWVDSEGHLQTACGEITGVVPPESFLGTPDEAVEYYRTVALHDCPSDSGVQEKPFDKGPEAPNP